ncbi:TPA: hypothetical protein N0F65_003076 [Lagenidium giganteum]|uniref:25S rRNA (uridine-N(3))-methyltransferase BMT5-like domain-containing protein n=1 Tax=Lagenidium giganteum TaxID=4803 RepID=A0AAV2YLA1_9STRA|nr:TPA: hypothetical protein N0F65_003076 [Lagenidium giganteum]
MTRKQALVEVQDDSTATAAPKELAWLGIERVRNLDKLYVHEDTMMCALHRCRPCCYKVVLHGGRELLANQRPELCPRMAQPKRRRATAGLYDAQHTPRVLTVGDGNFSFSLAIAKALAEDENWNGELVATSHESRESVVETYPDGESILTELAAMVPRVRVLHGVDATNAEQMHALGDFDRVVWNFPCVRVPRGEDGQNKEMERNKELLRGFFACVKPMVTARRGQVHVTHKTKPPFGQWGLEGLAAAHALRHVRSVIFDRYLYPGYSNKKVLAKGSFPIWDSQTFVFAPEAEAATEPEAAATTEDGKEAVGADADADNTTEALTPVDFALLKRVYNSLTPTLDELTNSKKRPKKRKADDEVTAAASSTMPLAEGADRAETEVAKGRGAAKDAEVKHGKKGKKGKKSATEQSTKRPRPEPRMARKQKRARR